MFEVYTTNLKLTNSANLISALKLLVGPKREKVWWANTFGMGMVVIPYVKSRIEGYFWAWDITEVNAQTPEGTHLQIYNLGNTWGSCYHSIINSSGAKPKVALRSAHS